MTSFPGVTRRSTAVALLLACVTSGPMDPGTLHGQAPADALTLERALLLAERHNPAYRRATNALALDAVEQREAWTRLLPRPQLSVLNTQLAWNLQRVGTDPFGNPLPNPEAQMVQSSQSRQQAALNFTFNFAEYMSFKNRGAAAFTRRVNVTREHHELRVEVERGFLQAQQQQALAGLEEELLERQRLNREVAGRLYALAQRERLDLLEADLDVAAQEEQLRQSRAALRTALLALQSLIGDSTLAIPAVAPIAFHAVDPERLEEELLVQLALSSHPSLALQNAEIHNAHQDLIDTRWQQWLPTLSLSFTTSRTEISRDGGGAFFDLNPSGGWDRNVTIAVNFPDLGRIFGTTTRLQAQHVTLRNAEESLREQRLQVEQRVRATLVDLRTAHGSVTLQERRVSLARERLATRLESYRLGRGTYMDLQTATEAVASAERALLTSRYHLEAAVNALELTLGLPIEQIAGLGRR